MLRASIFMMSLAKHTAYNVECEKVDKDISENDDG